MAKKQILKLKNYHAFYDLGKNINLKISAVRETGVPVLRENLRKKRLADYSAA